MSAVRSETFDPLMSEDLLDVIRSTMTGLGDQAPFAAALAGALAAEEFRDYLPAINFAEHVAVRIKVPGASHTLETAAAMTWVVATMLKAGIPFSIAEEAGDSGQRPFTRIAPREGAPANSNGSTEEFRFHVDNGVMLPSLRPRYISLTSLINEAHAETGIVPIEKVIEHLPPALCKAAFECRFVTASPPSFGESAFSETGPRPLVVSSTEGLKATFNTYRTRPYDPSDHVAAEVLKQIEKCANQLAEWIDLQPDEIFFFDNERSMHSRRPIVGRRLLLRAYWRRSLADLRRLASTKDALQFSARKALSLPGSN